MNEKLERIKDRLVHGTGETRETVREETARQGAVRPVDGAPAGPPEASPAGVLPGDRLVAGRRDEPARDGLADDDTAPTTVITDRPGDAPGHREAAGRHDDMTGPRESAPREYRTDHRETPGRPDGMTGHREAAPREYPPGPREAADRPGVPAGEAVRPGRPDPAHDGSGAPSPVTAAYGVPGAPGASDAHDPHGASLPGRGVPSPAPGGVSPAPGGPSPARGDGHSPTGGGPLFEHDADEIRRRWQEVQVGFVDDPRDSVTRADALLEELVGSLRTALERRTASLRQRWDGDEHDTERLRTALRDYRATLEQLLNLSSGTR
ncbi:hypothetical protein [Streptosporangium sandarakinum]|uniref:hypothetical protein n=1 Tax=Streptosporangium sandarakinum TaxID=1260955 RepID=UPI003428BB84